LEQVDLGLVVVQHHHLRPLLRQHCKAEDKEALDNQAAVAVHMAAVQVAVVAELPLELKVVEQANLVMVLTAVPQQMQEQVQAEVVHQQ
jgi:hypothetical protein